MALATLLVIVIVAGYPLLSTGLRSIDDHEYLTFRLINPSGSPWAALRNASVKSIRELDQARWRPLYQFGRSLTTALISDSTLPRYLWRLLVTAFVVWGIAAKIVSEFAPVPHRPQFRYAMTVTSGLVLLSVADWTDVTARLGPQEIFALSGLALTLLGLTAASQWRHKTVVLAGIILMCGYKENFAILATLWLLAYYLACPSVRRQWSYIFSTAIALLSTAVSFGAVRAKDNTDFYGQDRSFGTSLRALSTLLDSTRFEWAAFLLAIAVFAARPGSRRVIVRLGLLLLGTLALEWIVYGESMNDYGRYAVVSDLVVGSLVSINLLLLLNRARIAISSSRRISRILPLATLIFGVAVAYNPIQDLRQSSNYVKQEALEWSTAVGQILTMIDQIPSKSVLLIVDAPGASEAGRYEKTLSLITFLSFYSVSTPSIYVTVQNAPPNANTSSVRRGLEAISTDGGARLSTWPKALINVRPIQELNPHDSVRCIHYSTSGRWYRESTRCEESIRFSL